MRSAAADVPTQIAKIGSKNLGSRQCHQLGNSMGRKGQAEAESETYLEINHGCAMADMLVVQIGRQGHSGAKQAGQLPNMRRVSDRLGLRAR